MTTTEPAARGRSFVAAEREVLLAFFVSRMLVWVLAWLAFRWIVHGMAFPVASETEMWNLLFRWDSNWYGRIAQMGYEYSPDKPSSAAFFPLYPLCVRLVSAITGAQVSLAGFLVSNTALLGAVVLLRRLVALDFPAPSRVPERTVWLFLLCPVTFFYSSTYTESLFVLLSIAALLAARHRRWALAGLAGALLTGTRINGLIILVPLLWEAFGESRRSSDSEIGAAGILRSRWWLMIVPLGFVTTATYFYFRFGDALAFAHAQATWLRRLGPPWSALWNTWQGHPPGYGAWFVGAAAAGAILFLVAWRVRLPKSYLLYAGVMVLALLSQTILESLPRYLSVIFPLHIGLAAATARSEGLYLAALVTSTGLMALCLVLFAGGYWMT
jgi:hypothetical protein